jgi:hypothetical protein
MRVKDWIWTVLRAVLLWALLWYSIPVRSITAIRFCVPLPLLGVNFLLRYHQFRLFSRYYFIYLTWRYWPVFILQLLKLFYWNILYIINFGSLNFLNRCWYSSWLLTFHFLHEFIKFKMSIIYSLFFHLELLALNWAWQIFYTTLTSNYCKLF